MSTEPGTVERLVKEGRMMVRHLNAMCYPDHASIVERLTDALAYTVGLAYEFEDRGETAKTVAEYLDQGQASASRGSAGAYFECARLLRLPLNERGAP